VDIYVDTSAFYSLADRGDRHHDEAVDVYREHAGRDRFLTSELVLAESWLLLQGRLGQPAALDWLAGIQTGIVQVIPTQDSDLEAAYYIARRYWDEGMSLVDCVSFTLMERLKIETAFAFGRAFRLYRYGPRSDRAFRLINGS
jgi:predicted nucleic acid-binding protein